MPKSLRGAVVLITGAGGGLGQSMVRQFLAAGSQLILADRDAQELQATTTAVLSKTNLTHAPDAILGYLAADLATAEGAQSLYDAAMPLAPSIDILVNNAGIGMSGSFAEIPQDRWELLMQINLLAPMRLTSLFLPAMIARHSGHIVNISSVAGLVGSPQLVPYSAAKFGLRGFSEALAGDVKRHGIAVTALYPFFARTPILQSPHYGTTPQTKLPDRILYDPDFVIQKLLRGIQRGKLHVYPGMIPREVDLLRRFAPGLLPMLFRG